ncbi:MAG: DUF3344 domain-containing protein, partial [Thermoplasmata archaeon]
MELSNRQMVVLICTLFIIQSFQFIPDEVQAEGNGILNSFFTWEGNGGYVASGNGTWNSTSGSIDLSGIPSGASILKAFIYWVDWSGDGLDTFIYVDGTGVTGSQIGYEGSWYSFRANVTGLITGNGIYNITDIEAFGTSIVVVYSDSSSDYVKVMINDGMDTDYNQALPHWLTDSIFTGFLASPNPSANITFISGDGQIYYQGDWRYDKYSFNGNVIATDEADGSDGNPFTHGWDTDTYDVSMYVSQGDTAATASIYEENDEIGWVVSVFSVTVEPPNIPPFADAGDDKVIYEGDTILLDGSCSYDPDGFLVSHEWDFNVSDGLCWDIGLPPDAPGQVVTRTYNTSGIYIATLNVTDDNGSYALDTCNITVLEHPTLYINISQNRNDVILSWYPPSNPGIDYYLIYRSESQVGFDFTDPWVNTSMQYEPGESSPIPLRTVWNDTDAALPSNETNYKEQYYYILRSVNIHGGMSRTSRTVGKWTRCFLQGVSSFSLPLAPIYTCTIDNLTALMNASYIKYKDLNTHTWMRHDLKGGENNNTVMRLGEGYVVKFAKKTNHTFTGMPAAMIIYDDDNGFPGFDPYNEARNLTVNIEPNGEVNLTWDEPSIMGPGDWYVVYYSNSRVGFFGILGVDYFMVCQKIKFGMNTALHIDASANRSDTQLYYMVIP